MMTLVDGVDDNDSVQVFKRKVRVIMKTCISRTNVYLTSLRRAIRNLY